MCSAAEDSLASARRQPQCTPSVLGLLTQEQVPLQVRQAAAVFFKNVVRQHWAPEDEHELTIPDEIKTQVKDNLLQLFLGVADILQSQLSEAMSLIASHDFPQKWQTLLPGLLPQVEAATTQKDYKRVAGLLQILHSICKRYRHEFKSDELFSEIKYVLDKFQAPLLAIFKVAVADLPLAAGDPAASKVLLHCLTLVVSLHYDLCAQDLPEFFEDNMQPWMEGFVVLLKYQNPALNAEDDETEPSAISVLQAEVVDDLSLLMSKEEEAFAPFLPGCLGEVWNVLMATGLHPHQDLLVTTAMRFLTTIATSVHHHLFAAPDVLTNVCQRIISPNVQLLEADAELFEENPFEYVRRDVEGSDSDTRRRGACDLVRGLCRNYEKQVTDLFSGDIGTLLQQFAANPAANWKAKDAAIYLVIALTLKGSTSRLGATQTNALVNLGEFFTSHVLPELSAASGGGGSHPVLVADAIKFVTVFRNQLDRAAYEQVMPTLAALLRHKETVVHTYAATAIERMLTVKEAAAGAAPAPTAPLRFGAPQLTPLLQPLLTALFGVLKTQASTENAYVMRAVMRVTVVAAEGMAPYANVCIEELKTILGRVCANPSNPSFNHYLFETIASLVRYICAATPAAVDAFEAMLFPPFQQVLQADISEFTPYIFQVLAQLLECRTGLSPAYESLFPPLLTPTMWERPGNVPALVRLICAYMAKGKAQVLERLELVLGVFQKLLASRTTDAQACKLLSAAFTAFELAELQRFAADIFGVCLRRLQSNKKVSVPMVATFSIFVARFGATTFRAQLEAMQPGLCAMILQNVWAANAAAVPAGVPRKTVAISSTRLLCECPELLADAATFGAVLNAVLLLLLAEQGMAIGTATGVDLNAEEEEGIDIGAGATGAEPGYVAAYAQLHFASGAEVDLYADQTPLDFLRASLARLSSSQPGQLQPIVAAVAAKLPADKQQGVQALLQGVAL